MMPYKNGSAATMIDIPPAVVRSLTQYPIGGKNQSARVGHVGTFPVLYACGTRDPSDLCKVKFSEQSRAKISNYTYVRLINCSHDVLGCVDAAGRPIAAQREALELAIQAHIVKAADIGPDIGPGPRRSSRNGSAPIIVAASGTALVTAAVVTIYLRRRRAAPVPPDDAYHAGP